jgi:NADP-dependent 3-hydroxy acid dehydrogenase YdfG
MSRRSIGRSAFNDGAITSDGRADRRLGFKMALDTADTARSSVLVLDQAAHVQIAEMMILPVNRY